MIAQVLGRERRRARRVALPSPRRVPLRAVLALIGALAVLACGWLWLRNSPLVAVRRVSVTGIGGPDAARIRSALSFAARSMTTLDVSVKQLRTVAAPYPEVKDLRVSTHFPHAMHIQVIEQVALAAVSVNGRSIAVGQGGILLPEVPASSSLPLIALRVLPGGPRVTDATALQEIALLGAAPYPFIAKISQVTTDPRHGLVAQVRGGPAIYFGDPGRPAAKWVAALEALGDPGSDGAGYLDVSDPGHPAAGITGGD